MTDYDIDLEDLAEGTIDGNYFIDEFSFGGDGRARIHSRELTAGDAVLISLGEPLE